MGGGFVGGVHDPHDSGVYTEIILRPDSTIEYYQRDTLLWRGTLTMMPKRFKTIELKVVGYGPGDWEITLDDINHIGFGGIDYMDGIGFGFVRR